MATIMIMIKTIIIILVLSPSRGNCDQLLVFLRRIWFLLPQACVVQRVPLWLNDKSPNPQNSIFKRLRSVNVRPRRLLSLVLLNRVVRMHAFPPPPPQSHPTMPRRSTTCVFEEIPTRSSPQEFSDN